MSDDYIYHDESPGVQLVAQELAGKKSVNWNGTPVRHPDGRVHFSQLKEMAESPADYRHACLHPKPPTDAMRIGSLVDAIVFPGTHDYVVYEGRRQGEAWERFRTRYASFEIYTQSELDRAKPAADAVLTDPVAAKWLRGVHQVKIEWDAFGLRCGGKVDVIGDGHITELKVTDSEPTRLARHARKMCWPQQLVWYAQHLPIMPKLAIVAVNGTDCAKKVTVSVLTPAMVESAHRSLVLWTERLRTCDTSGHWPGYVESEVELDVDAWDVGAPGDVDADDST